MTMDEFLAMVKRTAGPAPLERVANFEHGLQEALPDDYRGFLILCNGGHVGGRLWFRGPTPEGRSADAGVHHIGGFRTESHFSLEWHRECYRGRIPRGLIWIMDDPFGNAICLGIEQPHRGKIFFWDHELEPDPSAWDKSVESAGNVQLLANTFTDFVGGLGAPNEELWAKRS